MLYSQSQLLGRGLLSHTILYRHCSSNVKPNHSHVFKQSRLEKLQRVEKYTHQFKSTVNIRQFRDKYECLQANNSCEEQVRLCGMITSCRDYGKNLKFVDIERDEVKLQLKFAKSNFPSDQEFLRLTDMLAKGDKIGR